MKKLVAVNRENGKTIEVIAEEVLVASESGPSTDVLHPERGEIKTDEDGL